MRNEPNAVRELIKRAPARPEPDITDAVTAWAMFTASLALTTAPLEGARGSKRINEDSTN